MKSRGRAIHGWIAVDKPLGLSAAQVVARVKRSIDAAKAGHGGTLDPMATGILPIALGEATKTVSYVMDGATVYEFEVTWGAATTTDDAEGEVSETSPVRPGPAEIQAALPAFVGTLSQVPPAYSAIKVDGRRAYARARADEPVELAARPVEVASFELLDTPDGDHARFRVGCGKGTYVRALARDLARALGTCGHVSALRRTACGPFTENTAISLAKLEALGHKAADSECLLPLKTVLDDIPVLALTAEEARRIRLGPALALWPRVKRNPLPGLQPGTAVQARLGDRVVALGEVGQGMVRPLRVLNE
jgi:tRNA pseudouridine55 synthase